MYLKDYGGSLMVTIRCMTFNHEAYIRQCLEGIVLQRTNFRFEAIVHDDASTDGTAKIVREYAEKYPDIIKPIIETENQYSKHKGIITKIMNEHTHGKYVALCEGDDYWIDPFKLQKQVDFLEKYKDYGLVYTNVDFYFQDRNEYEESYITSGKIKHSKSFIDHLTYAGYIAPCTWLYRRKYAFLTRKRYVDTTFPLALDIWADSKIYFMDESTTVYRVLNESASHSKSLYKKFNIATGVFQIQKDYVDKYIELVTNDVKQTVYAKRYSMILPLAITLNKQEFLNEAEQFFKTNFALQPLLMLKLRKVLFLKCIFAFLYKRRGFDLK